MEKILFVKGVDKGKRGLKQLVALGGEWRAAPFPKHNLLQRIGQGIYSR